MESELTHLIKMINQIGDNQPKQLSVGDAANKVAEHVNKFWAKPMRQKILALDEESREQLTPIAQVALKSVNAPA